MVSLNNPRALVHFLFILLIVCFVHFVHGQDDRSHYTEAEKSAIDKFRPLAAQYLLAQYMKTDNYHLRVLKFAKFDIGRALENVKASSQWRKEYNADNILDEDLTSHRRFLPFKTGGVDREGTPILEIYFGKWELRKYALAGKRDIAVKTLVQSFEIMEMELFKIEKSGVKNITTIYILEDVHGFTLTQTACLQCIPIITDFMRILVTHYPSFIKKSVVINAPRIFAPIIAVFKQIFPPEVAKLINIYGPNKEEWYPIVSKDISQDQLPKIFGGNKDN